MIEYKNEIVVFSQTRPSDSWGLDYLAELRRILDQHVKPVTRAFLEWGAGNSTLAIIQWRETLAVDRFYSVDDNADYLAELVPQFPQWSGFHPICANLTGPTQNDCDQGFNYSTLPLTLEL